MASPSKPKQPWLDVVAQSEASKSSTTGSSGNVSRSGGPTARTPTSLPDNNGPQTLFQHPAHSLAAPQAVMRPLITPFTGVSGISAPPVVAKYGGSVSNTDTGESYPKRNTSSRIPYETNAMPPAFPQENSIYPVNSQLRRVSVRVEASTDPKRRPSAQNNWNPQFSLQNQVRRECERLWTEKESKMRSPSRPTTAISEKTNRVDRNTDHQSDGKVPAGDSISREKTEDTLGVWLGSIYRDNETDPAYSDRDLTMFEDTPRDQYLVKKREKWVYYPWNIIEPDHTPSLSALSSMTEWDPELDKAFQIDAEWNLEEWGDFRFRSPQTPADIESLQQALEITRMDFWIRNPTETYPEDLSPYKRESYGSQHRRLQHAFCRIWQEFDSEPAPELYRLPNWMFGFDMRYWKPSSWGGDTRSNAYNQALAEMAAERNEKSLQSLDYRHWKARLEELVGAATAHCATEVALFAGPKKM